MSHTRRPGAFDHGDDFGERRDVAAREDVLRDPGIGDVGAVRTADRMQHHDAVIGEQFGAAPEIGLVEIDADMLEHSDRHDAVERAFDVAIVLEQELAGSRQILLGRAGIRHLQLLGRQRDAGDVGAGRFPRDTGRGRPNRSRCRARGRPARSTASRRDDASWRAGHRQGSPPAIRNRRNCTVCRHRERANRAARRDRNGARHCSWTGGAD